MLSPLSPSNSPPAGLRARPSSLKSASASLNQEELFQHHTVAFLYLKREKQWKELGEGPAKFAFDRDTSSIIIRRGETVFHKVSLSTKIQAQVASSQSWVFRAVHCMTGSHDVLCLQIPENAKRFVEMYEMHRISSMQTLENAKSLGKRSTSGSSTSTTASTLPYQESAGSDLSEGFRSIALRSTVPVPSENASMNEVKSTDDTSTMRRRLSTYGADYALDGYAPGARHEDRSVRSPTQKSPIRPSASGSAKTLRPIHPSAPSVVTFSGMSVKGVAPYNPDKQNQDALVLHQMPSGEVVFSVFDGHGEEGRTVSQHFRNSIPRLLASNKLFANSATTGDAIKEALDAAERDIVDDVHVDTTLSGTTGVVAVLRGQKLFVANVGDSRAIFGLHDPENRHGFVAKEITTDHKPDTPEEKKRILEIGGRVFAVKFDDGIDGPARVWLSYAELPGLAMSRSLGDTIAKEAGVISVPDLFEEDITPAHKFLVMASDGLWEFMSNQEIVDIVAKYANSPNPDPEGAIDELIEESSRRWRMNEPVIDDTSIIVAFFM